MKPIFVRAWLALVGICSLLAAFASCSATSDHVFGTGGAGGETSASTNSGPGAGGGIHFDGGGDATGPCSTCSADLKKVLDCNGGLIKTCTGGQACANGDCIADACMAAQLAKSSIGCDYYALKTDIITPDGDGACFAAFVANTWSVPVHINVDRQGQPIASSAIAIPQGQGQSLSYSPYDPVKGLGVGEVAVIFLSQGPKNFSFMPDCPVPAALQIEAGVSGTGLGTAFHLTSDQPIVAYQMLPFGGGSSAATSATLLLPTNVWDTNYIAINAFTKSQVAPQAMPSLDILAYEDNTQVTILPKVAIVGGNGLSPGPANAQYVFNLSKGQYAQLSQGEELSGSVIQSTKPIGVWGGASCLNIQAGECCCDSSQQQLPPIKALGYEYVGVRYRGRQGNDAEAPPWRVVGAVDGTQLTWMPSQGPGVINKGQVVEFPSTGPFWVKSQDKDHPFYLGGHMTGGEAFNGEGDPEWVNVTPVQQYLDSYVLFTDPTYSETELLVVRRPDPNGKFADVNLDCLGVVGNWQPIGPYEWTRVDLVTGNFTDVGNCSNGRHEMKSDLPFGVTVWGWGTIPGIPGQPGVFTQYVSYAYPAGASVQPINTVVVPPTPN